MPKSIQDPVYRELIARIVDARIDAQHSQATVAGRLGRPQSYVAKVEGCERRIDVVEMLHLADAIGIDPIPLVRAAWKSVRADG